MNTSPSNEAIDLPKPISTGQPASIFFRKTLAVLKVASMLLAVLVLFSTVATQFAANYWFSDLLANLRVQQCLMVLLTLALVLVLRSWVWLALVSICLVMHLPWFFYCFDQPASQTSDMQPLKVMVINVASGNDHYEEFVADVLGQSPDILVVLELRHPLARYLESALAPTYGASVIRATDAGAFGIGLYSRHPIVSHEVFRMNAKIDSITASLDVDGKPHRVFATHPYPPFHQGGYRLRNQHLQQLAGIIEDIISHESNPTILAGDLNVTPWSPHFQALQQTSGLRLANDGFSVRPTWYSQPIFPCGLVLDHVLISDQLTCTRRTIGPDIGSDHRSVTVTLVPSNEERRLEQD